ncbi:MAG TPA: hypothetical protein VHB20_10610 [Verrucomicrobiae bacterium]|jgi:hypothetical protein|nr:hypothetical protein [Verrucomicrobiae bacterium]
MNTATKSNRPFAEACVASCQKVLAQIQKARTSVLVQFRGLIAEHDQALRLALNEAEALAFQTPFPHLVFQDLAEEKARAVAEWSEHQRYVLSQTGAEPVIA